MALGLGLGLTARDMTEFLVTLGPGVFPPGYTPTLRLLLGFDRYDPGPLRSALAEVFGKKTLADSHVRLLIPSFDASKADIHIYKTAHSKRLMMDYRVEAVEVAMATAAAPTLPSVRLKNKYCVCGRRAVGEQSCGTRSD